MSDITTFVWIAIFSIGAMIVNSIGIWFVYKNIKWAEKTKEYFMCFAAGVLIASPLIMAFPQAIAKNSYAGFAALIGFLFMFFSNKLIKYKTKQKELEEWKENNGLKQPKPESIRDKLRRYEQEAKEKNLAVLDLPTQKKEKHRYER